MAKDWEVGLMDRRFGFPSREIRLLDYDYDWFGSWLLAAVGVGQGRCGFCFGAEQPS
jgi:hypothetical protein